MARSNETRDDGKCTFFPFLPRFVLLTQPAYVFCDPISLHKLAGEVPPPVEAAAQTVDKSTFQICNGSSPSKKGGPKAKRGSTVSTSEEKRSKRQKKHQLDVDETFGLVEPGKQTTPTTKKMTTRSMSTSTKTVQTMTAGDEETPGGSNLETHENST